MKPEDSIYIREDSNRSYKSQKIVANPDVHHPSKIEAKIVRKLSAKHRLTEDELRSIKKYRKEIADYVKVNSPKQKPFYLKVKSTDEIPYGVNSVIRKATELTGRHPLHTETLEKAIELIDGSTYMWDSYKKEYKEYIEKLLEKSKGTK